MSPGSTIAGWNCPLGVRRGLLLMLAATAAMLGAVAGCGSSSGGHPVAVVTGRVTPTATLTPVPFARAAAVPLAVTSDPNLPHWFVLVNGASVPSPLAVFTPSVLTVNGSSPAGSPNPNGGTDVGPDPMTLVVNPVPQASPSAEPTAVPFAFTEAQVWQAVPGTRTGYYYLRSGESFTVDRTNNPVGSLMLGYGAHEAVSDLGYLPSWYTAIYLDQSNSPTGDNSCFEQWSYDIKTAQLTNCYTGGQLNGPSAPGNQWYALPNYELEQIVNQVNCDQNPQSTCTQDSSATNATFPVWTTNQQNAYNYVSQQTSYTGNCIETVGLGTNQQSLMFSGVRCQYSNKNNNAPNISEQANRVQYPSATPSPYFALADLQAVQNQLDTELNYVNGVYGMLSNAKSVLSTVFIENSNTVNAVVTDLAVSTSAKPYCGGGANSGRVALYGLGGGWHGRRHGRAWRPGQRHADGI